MKISVVLAATIAVFLSLPNISFSQTGRCGAARDVVEAKSWDVIRYKYSPQYIEDNHSDFTKAVEAGGGIFYKDCQSNNLSDEQILLQGALDVAAMPAKFVADKFLSGLGLPPLGDKAFHIDVKAIEKNGVFGGKNSFFRKPFG